MRRQELAAPEARFNLTSLIKTKNQTWSTGRAVKVAGGGSRLPAATIGLDLGDKTHSCCVPDATEKILKKESITNDRPALGQLTAAWPDALIVMEAGGRRAGGCKRAVTG